MKIFMHWLITHFLFAGTLFFAAGAPTLTDAGAGDGNPGADAGTSDLGGGAESDTALGDETQVDETTELDSQEDAPREQADNKDEEPELAEFKGSVTARFRKMAKEAPELFQALQKYPKVQEQIEAVFRRESALREMFPTVAEARQMREHFPNGLSDVQQLMTDVQEVEALDKDFYTRDQEGNYSGHGKIVSNMFQDDPAAAVAFFKTLPKEWARLDRESYDQVMGKIVGATLLARQIPEYISDLVAAAKEAKQEGLAGSLQKLLNWAEGYTDNKARSTPEDERLQRERASFAREKQDRLKEDGQRFHSSFVSSSRKLQMDIINNHPAMKRLLTVKAITPEKRAKIADEVRARIEKLLTNSQSFMRKLKPAYESRNIEETAKLQKAAWSQPWLLNKMVREVLRAETPALVEGNRDAARRRAGAPAGKKPAIAGERKGQPTGPRQINGRWIKADGTPFTTAEVVAGKHLL